MKPLPIVPANRFVFRNVYSRATFVLIGEDAARRMLRCFPTSWVLESGTLRKEKAR